MAVDLFNIEYGLSIDSSISILYGTASPTSGGGVTAPIGSVYCETDSGVLWHKTGSGATSWAYLMDSSGVSTEDTNQNSFVGKSTSGAIMPTYSSNLVVTTGQSLSAAISNLDASSFFSKTESSINASGGYAVDAIAMTNVKMVEWTLTVRETSTPSNMTSRKIHSVTDGTSVNFNDASIVSIGSNIAGLVILASKVSTNLVLTVTCTNTIDYHLIRLARTF